MASISRHVHLRSDFQWGTLAELAPDLVFTTDVEDPMGLRFVDDDGETHVFAFGEDGRKALLAQLSGVVVASTVPVLGAI